MQPVCKICALPKRTLQLNKTETLVHASDFFFVKHRAYFWGGGDTLHYKKHASTFSSARTHVEDYTTHSQYSCKSCDKKGFLTTQTYC